MTLKMVLGGACEPCKRRVALHSDLDVFVSQTSEAHYKMKHAPEMGHSLGLSAVLAEGD